MVGKFVFQVFDWWFCVKMPSSRVMAVSTHLEGCYKQPGALRSEIHTHRSSRKLENFILCVIASKDIATNEQLRDIARSYKSLFTSMHQQVLGFGYHVNLGVGTGVSLFSCAYARMHRQGFIMLPLR